MCGGWVGDKLGLRPKLPDVVQQSPAADAAAAEAAKAAAMAASAQDRQMRRRSSLLLTGRAGSDSETGSTSRTTARPVLGG